MLITDSTVTDCGHWELMGKHKDRPRLGGRMRLLCHKRLLLFEDRDGSSQ